MDLPTFESPYARREGNTPFGPSDGSSPPQHMAGLPLSWRHYGWWVASFIYAGIWMANSLRTGRPLVGATYFNHMTRSLWEMLVTAALCYGVLQFSKHHSENQIGKVVCCLLALLTLAGQLL